MIQVVLHTPFKRLNNVSFDRKRWQRYVIGLLLLVYLALRNEIYEWMEFRDSILDTMFP